MIRNPLLTSWGLALALCGTAGLSLPTVLSADERLGEHEALRVYVEFADGSHRGMYDPATGKGGIPDEPYDATTAMVINWHRLPGNWPERDARLRYRQVHPERSDWQYADGESFAFWHRAERIHRVVLTGLEPNSVYAFQVRAEGQLFRFRTMPACLEQRPVSIVMAGDHQQPSWNTTTHRLARMTAWLQPDMFAVKGDYVNCEGRVTAGNAERWARYLDTLYGVAEGYFLYTAEIDGQPFENVIIPHVAILGNHETGDQHHIRWPSCVATGSSRPGYPQFTAANWMELLFHFPYRSEGFYSEFRPDHPNINPDWVQDGFGHGGFGKLSFSNYLLLIGLDNSQNWEGEPERGLRDWEGNLITEKWPWFETQHADVRQDLWLQNLLEPEHAPPAGERYLHILPFWHRGLFGSSRLQMSLKNRGLMEYWLPILYRNGVRMFGEAHDHMYGRTVPMTIRDTQPEGTRVEKVYYEPASWPLSPDLPAEYRDAFFAVDCLKDQETGEIVGWAYKGRYITYAPQGMRAFGHGGWGGGRARVSNRGAGNAGWWFADPERGGKTITGSRSYHVNRIVLCPQALVTQAVDVGQFERMERGEEPEWLHHVRWDRATDAWSDVP